jgi:hypothetical protein
MRKIQLRVICTADDDGGKAASTTAQDVVTLVQRANSVFAKADVEFVFDPAKHLTNLNSTLLNRRFTLLEPLDKAKDPEIPPRTTEVPNELARIRFAELFLRDVVVYFSYNGELAFSTNSGHWKVVNSGLSTASGLGWYVSMAQGASGTSLAHELGHFLSNWHTFGKTAGTIAEAADAIRKYVEVDGHPRAEGADVFDFDNTWVTDTPSDPGTALFGTDYCGSTGTVEIPVTFSDQTKQTYVLKPDRSNVMSYFQCATVGKPVRLSTQQARRVRDTLETGIRGRLIAPARSDVAGELVRQSSASAGTVHRLAAVAIGGGRLVTAVRDGSGNLKVIAWGIGPDGSSVERLGSASAGTGQEVAASFAGLGLVATAVRTATGTLKVILWKVDEAGQVTRAGDGSAGAIGSALSICRVGLGLVVTSVITGEGNLKVIAWSVTASGEITRQADATAGAVSRIASAESWPLRVTDDGLESNTYGQLTTAVRDSAGNLKLIHWAITKNGKSITRLADSIAGAVDDIAMCPVVARTLVTAVRDASGRLKLITWALDDAGLAIERWDSTSGGEVTEIAACTAGLDLFTTALRTAAGDLQLVVWQTLADGAETIAVASGVAGSASLVSVCQIAPRVLATPVRDGAGNLKVIAWKLQ